MRSFTSQEPYISSVNSYSRERENFFDCLRKIVKFYEGQTPWRYFYQLLSEVHDTTEVLYVELHIGRRSPLQSELCGLNMRLSLGLQINSRLAKRVSLIWTGKFGTCTLSYSSNVPTFRAVCVSNQ